MGIRCTEVIKDRNAQHEDYKKTNHWGIWPSWGGGVPLPIQWGWYSVKMMHFYQLFSFIRYLKRGFHNIRIKSLAPYADNSYSVYQQTVRGISKMARKHIMGPFSLEVSTENVSSPKEREMILVITTDVKQVTYIANQICQRKIQEKNMVGFSERTLTSLTASFPDALPKT